CSRTLRPVWRPIIAAGRKPSEVITIAASQTGRASKNTLRLTADHKMFVINNRQLTKKRLDEVLLDGDFLSVVDHVPGLTETATSPALAYVAGAIFSDGYINLKPTKGSVTFIQKPTPEKAEFIAAVEETFEEAFGVPFTYLRERKTESTLRGRTIKGQVEDRICFRREPAERLSTIRDNLSAWVLSLDRPALLSFLGGFVDGDGTYSPKSSAVRIQICVSHKKRKLLEGLAVACLRLDIVPQISNNRNHYVLQITEHVDEILMFSHRLHATVPARTYESKCLAVEALFDDIVDDVNYHGRVREGIKRNLMFGVEKLRRDVLPLCEGETYKEVESLLDARLRSYRVRQVGEVEAASVYNFEVDATDELDKNFIVFSSRLTPVLVSNSHAAVVARGWGKPCVAGCGEIVINYKTKSFTNGRVSVKEGDWISINGATGEVILGQQDLVEPELGDDFAVFMAWADEFRPMGVRTNADTPEDAEKAITFGAEGIGLCRTEHMFFEGDRIVAMRRMIMADDEAGRRAALAEILPMQRADFIELFRIMAGRPVT
ncbi:MAG: putative PEP-binding protein, partial [Rhodothermales bacterium]